MAKILTSILLLLIFFPVYSQNITSFQADSLRRSLIKNKSTTGSTNSLIKLAEFYVMKPGELKIDFDSAEDYLNKATIQNATMKSAEISGYINLVLSKLNREKQMVAPGKVFAENAVRILKNEKNKYLLGDAYFELSQYYDYSDPTQIVEKIKLVNLASQQFQLSGNLERLAYTLKFAADLYQVNNENSKAIDKLNLSLKVYESIHHYDAIQEVYILYGSIYYSEGNFKKALDYSLLALKTAEDAHDTSMTLCQIKNRIGTIYYQLSDKEKAIKYHTEALEIAEKYNDNKSILLLMFNITQNMLRLKKDTAALNFIESIPKKFLVPGDEQGYIYEPLCYLLVFNRLKNYKQSTIYSNRVLKVLKEHKNQDKIVNNAYVALIGFYLGSKQYSSAHVFIKKIDSLSKKIGDPFRIEENFMLRFRLDTAQGNYMSAVNNLLKYKSVNDSLFNVTKSRQIKQLEVEYETGKKADSLKLKDKDILVLNQQNQQVNLVKNVTIGGILLLMIIVALLLRQYRHKQQSNLVITGKNKMLENLVNEKEWLLKEVHHRVKNNLQIIISLLNTQSNYLESDAAIKAIRESQERMNAISLIHQKLYKSEDSAFINIREYVHELVEHIRNGFKGSSAIVFDLNISDVQMDVAQAVPIGLILNEAISNVIKYAFPGNSSGLICISITHSDTNDAYLLTLADNGVGLPPDYDISKKSSLGMRLMQGLTKQLGGSFNIESNNGVQIKVAFRNSNLVKMMQPGEKYA